MNLKAKKVLVTGASGFVGSNVARYFYNNGFEVHVIVREKSNLWRISDLKKRIHFHFSDLTDTKTLKKVFLKTKPHYIFHLAAYGAYAWQTDLKKMIQTNINGTLSVLEASAKVNYRCFVNAGSSSEYGIKKIPMREDIVLEPNSFYAFTKASGTMLCSVFANKYKKPIITFRLFSVYGPYEDMNRLIPAAMKNALNENVLDLTSKKEKRDFVYVDDVSNAFMCAVNTDGLEGQIFNIGTGKQYSNLDIARIVRAVSEKGLIMKVGSYKRRDWDSDFWVADISKSKALLRWKPEYSLGDGLKETYMWFKKNLHFYS